MRCPVETNENAELLLSYSARKLDPEATAVLEQHMKSCAACREFRDGQRLIWEALEQWDAIPVAPDFDRRLYRRIEEEGQLSWWQRLILPLHSPSAGLFWRPALPLAAVACVLVVAGFLLESPSNLPAENPLGREVEQVERTLEDLEMLRTFDLAARTEETSRAL